LILIHHLLNLLKLIGFWGFPVAIKLLRDTVEYVKLRTDFDIRTLVR